MDYAELLPAPDQPAGADPPHVGGPGRQWWTLLWAAMSPRRRCLVTAVTAFVVGVAVLLAGVAQARDWVAERQARERVVLSTSLGVWSSSTSPPGGSVTFFVSVRNAGIEPLAVTSVRASNDRLRLGTRDGLDRRVEAGAELLLPLSVLLTCAPPASTEPAELSAEIAVRRDDGRLVERPISLGQAGLVLDVADTVCSVRPELRGYELSGPVIRPDR